MSNKFTFRDYRDEDGFLIAVRPHNGTFRVVHILPDSSSRHLTFLKSDKDPSVVQADLDAFAEIANLGENPKSQSIGFLTDSDKVVQYHLAAERCANLSVWCAAMAGAEILKKKRDIGHGNGFSEWRKQLPFGVSTAKNYVNLSKKLEQRLNALPEDRRAALLPALANAQSETENMLELLNLPSPMDVFNPAHEQLADVIRDVTNGQTITQLYFDWDICKPSRKLGGNPMLAKFLTEFHPRIKATSVEELAPKVRKEFDAWLEEQEQNAKDELDAMEKPANKAKALWEELGGRMYEFFPEKRFYAFLPPPKQKEVLDFMKDCVKDLQDCIKQG